MGQDQAWLRYGSDKKKEKTDITLSAPKSEILKHAEKELSLDPRLFPEKASFRLTLCEELPEEGYRITAKGKKFNISGGSDRGIYYGVFALIRAARTGKLTLDREYVSEKAPACPLRMLNHWDNMDGTIERGYAGNSFFFGDNKILDGKKIRRYARLSASVGINAVVLNNVNVRGEATHLIDLRHRLKLKNLVDTLSEYGIRTFLSINFAAPITNGGLDTADPLDPKVRKWWKEKAEHLYSVIPNFGGFLVKADSEGRPGPFTYGRTHADGANMLAEAVKPYGGIIIWRCFVYNCQQDWRDTKTDRARAGYDNFKPLDGDFRENVVLQVKNGPMDFQVREPVSPLFGGMTETSQLLELEAAQEYTGQQKACCFLVPMWKEILEFETYVKKDAGRVRDIISGKTFGNRLTGMAAVANTGDCDNWCGHDLAQANWYGFGRLAFEPELTSEEIASDFVKEAYGKCPGKVQKLLTELLLSSYRTYEKYTSPLGIGWMVNPSHHYGVNFYGYEFDRWGTYHKASHSAIGVERNSTGTGYTEQYLGRNRENFEKPATTPEELLLFFHRLPYTYRLKDGRTIIQYIYDTHFEGADEAEAMYQKILSLKEYLSEERFLRLSERFRIQAEDARDWRDQINTCFYRLTEIPDEKGRTIYE